MLSLNYGRRGMMVPIGRWSVGALVGLLVGVHVGLYVGLGVTGVGNPVVHQLPLQGPTLIIVLGERIMDTGVLVDEY